MLKGKEAAEFYIFIPEFWQNISLNEGLLQSIFANKNIKENTHVGEPAKVRPAILAVSVFLYLLVQCDAIRTVDFF